MRNAEPAPLPRWITRRSAAWAGVLMSCIVLVLTASFIYHERQSLETAEVQRSELYARVLQDQAERTFNTIDISMGALAETLAPQPDLNGKAKLNGVLAQALAGLPFLRSLSLMDASGLIVASSTDSNMNVHVDLRHLKMPTGSSNDALGTSVVGRDLTDIRMGSTIAPNGGRTFVPLVRALGNSSEQPLYIVAALNPDFFGNEYELTLADEWRRAGMFSMDGVMFAGTANLVKAPGQSAREHRFFQRFLPARESGSFVGPGLDGSEVVTAFRVLRKRPIVIIVERDYAQLSGDFAQTRRWALCVATLAIAMIVMTVVLARRSLKSREAVQETLNAARAEVVVSERDLRTLVESVHELIFRADANGRIEFVNGRWQELTRRPASEAVGRWVTDLCREDEREACQALFSKVETDEETLLVHVLDASGAQLTLDLSVSRVLDANGRTLGFAGFAVDVSQRESAQQALQSQLKFTAQLLEVSPTPIFVKDTKGIFVTVNRAWLDLMNLQLPQVLGRSSADLFEGEAAKHQEQDDRILHSEERISYENQHRSPGREPRDTVVTKVRFTRADGTPAGIVGSIYDVTEFRAAEREIRQARDAAQMANRAKSEFIANMSHELRTPLQGIIGFSDIGRDMANAHPEFLEMFTDIRAGGQRMLTLVNALLDVSQMDSAMGSMSRQRRVVARLLRETLDELQAQADIRDLKLNVHGLDGLVQCDVDVDRFQQAVRNLLVNAIRYSPQGGTIDITLNDLGAAGVELTVRDRGPGVPEEELELIFEPFAQSSRTRDGSGGTGLGLTIARKIMGAHGGSVVAENADGGGALFSLRLPPVHRRIEPGVEQSGQSPERLPLEWEVNP